MDYSLMNGKFITIINMFFSKDNTFYKSKEELQYLLNDIIKILTIKKNKNIEQYIIAFNYFVNNPSKFDGATIVKDLVDIEELDLDAMVHDYEYLNGANRSFIKKWKADIRYIKNMEANGKGIRVFRFLILTLLGIFFVPYCYIKYKLN